MWAKLGNVSPKEAYREEVNPNDYDAEGLRAAAEKLGVDTKGTKEEIAARMSAVNLTRPLETEGTTVTTYRFPVDEDGNPAIPLMEAAQTITATWNEFHSDDPPEWVESDDPALASILASNYGCVVGRPAGLTVEGEDEV